MALTENGLKLGAGIGVGFGMYMLAPVLSPIMSSAVKPLAKAMIKNGLVVLGKGRKVVAGGLELVEDLVAEAKAELAETAAPTEAASGAGGQSPKANDWIVRGY